jgi:translation initiation factor RLI1
MFKNYLEDKDIIKSLEAEEFKLKELSELSKNQKNRLKEMKDEKEELIKGNKNFEKIASKQDFNLGDMVKNVDKYKDIFAETDLMLKNLVLKYIDSLKGANIITTKYADKLSKNADFYSPFFRERPISEDSIMDVSELKTAM